MPRELAITITANTAQAVQSLKQVDTAVDRVVTSTDRHAAATAKATDATQQFTAKHKEAADSVDHFGQFVDRIVERMAIYASVRGAIGAVESTVRWGQELGNLSAELDVTATRAQELSIAALKTNTPINSVTEGIAHLQQSIGGRDTGLLDALTRLGLSFESIRTSGTEAALDTIVRRMGTVKDQFEFAGDAADIFGARAGRRLTEMIRNWDDLKKSAHDANVILGDEQVAALEKAAVKWDILILKGKAYLADVLLAIGHAADRTQAGLQTAFTKAGISQGADTPTAPGSPTLAVPKPAGMPALTDPMLAYLDQVGKTLEHDTQNQIEAANKAAEAIHGLYQAWASFHEFTLSNISKVDEALKRQQENLMRGFGATNDAIAAELNARAAVNKSRGLDVFGKTAIPEDAAMTMQKQLGELHRTNPAGVGSEFREQAIIDDFNKAIFEAAKAMDASLIPMADRAGAALGTLPPAIDATAQALAKFTGVTMAPFSVENGSVGVPGSNVGTPRGNNIGTPAIGPRSYGFASSPTAGMFSGGGTGSLFGDVHIYGGVDSTDRVNQIATAVMRRLKQQSNSAQAG